MMRLLWFYMVMYDEMYVMMRGGMSMNWGLRPPSCIQVY